MKKCEFAREYLTQYDDTDVIIIDYAEFDGGVIFDLSDDTHWLADNNDNAQIAESLVDCEIGWSDTWGWIIINEDGTESQINWL